MLVNRRTFVTKPGKSKEVVELLVKVFERNPWPGPMRIYKANVGPFDHVVVDLETESLATYDQDHAQWFSNAIPEEAEAFQALIEPHGTNEVWAIAYEKVSNG